MKSKIILSIVLLFLTIAFISKIPTAEENKVSNLQPGSAIPDNEFMIGAMHSGYDGKDGYDFTHVKDTFNMNTWHKYTGPNWGWYLSNGSVDPNDTINQDTIHYHQNVKDRIDEATQLNLRTVMDRPYIQYLSFGQRSDYQCEDLQENKDTLWFYSYYNSVDNDSTINDTTDNSQFGDGQKVKLCLPSSSSAGYIVDSLKANREQANRKWPDWINDDTYNWYIKPRIRVDPSFVQNNPNDTICRIEIINWHGDTVKQVGILGKYFKDQYGNYDGSYLMEYNFDSPSDTELIVRPGWLLCPDPMKDFTDWQHVTIETDYRVYWYGTCEMWIDYVRVENEPSVHLQSGSMDDDVLREVIWALRDYNQNRPNHFYIEEFEFNILSSIKRVDSLLKEYSDNKLTLMVNFQYDLFRVHVPDVWQKNILFNKDFIKRFLIDSTGINYFVVNSYNLEGWKTTERATQISKHPNTLSSEDYDDSKGILSYKVSPKEYDTWLQNRFDTGTGFISYNYIMKLSDSLDKMQGVDIRQVSLQQAHLWFASGHKLKEPTYQEAEMMSDLAISYGAKGILYFAYNGDGDISGGSSFYMRGLTNPGWGLRYTNVYGQLKAQKYGEMNQKYNIWGPYIMSFDDENRKSYIYRLNNERNALIQNTYFLTARTFKPGSGTPICDPVDSFAINPFPEQSLTYDCQKDTYLQIALFDDDIADYDKYFMIINRRCSPFINSTPGDNNGGRRFVRVLFDANHSAFNGYNNWNIIDLENEDSVVVTFDKTKTENLDLDWFLPGEGRLYKIAPVIKY